MELGGDDAGVVPGVWGTFQELVGDGSEVVQGKAAARVLESGFIPGGQTAEEYLYPGDVVGRKGKKPDTRAACLLYTSDAADEL